ncbi:MAG: twin-arginine translocase subunit TatC [Betaproteobacteria bacterium]|nr:twin-arginine translocase subunit TatC [Betaproteobacteria bacterium]
MAAEENFLSHLLELRTRLLRAVGSVLVVFLALFAFRDKIYTALAHPLLAHLPKGGHMIATEVTTPFFVPVKVTLLAALLIALPYVLYQIWAFVAPGLYAHEKRLALPLVIASTTLFVGGMAFAYFLVLPIVFGFITHTTPTGVAVMTDIDKYVDFVLRLFVAFGITFQVPVAVILLVKMGVVSVEKLKQIRPYVIVGAFIVGAVLTPPDMLSQTMLAVPLWLLYELGIIFAGVVVRTTRRPEEPAEADERPLTEQEMDEELDRIEAQQKKAD